MAIARFYTSFTEKFPPPRFLEMPTVGLDISDSTIRFVELKRRGVHFHLGLYGEEKIPRDVIEEGYIKDKAKLTEVLTTVRRKNNLRFIRASLPEEKSYLFKTEIPMMPKGDIRSALKFKIEENVPVPLAKAVYDYHIIKYPKDSDSEKKISVSVTVVHTKVVSNYVDVLKGAKLIPLALQVESQAVAHAVLPRDSKETHILIAIRGGRSVLSIVAEGAVQFTSTLHIGGEAIAASIKKNLNVDENEAQKIRQGKEIRESNDIFLSLVNAATALRDEVQKLIAYWNGHSAEHGRDNVISSIIISGADALLGIDDYLSRSLDMKVTIANPWTNVLTFNQEIPPLTLRESLDYVPAIGLALPYD